jgi:putative membrane protein
MILPGISGAFILVMLGKYQAMLTAVTSRDLITLGVFGLGCIVGLISIAQVLSWLFRRYHDGTIVFLVGLMLGSLRRLWPWKQAENLDMAFPNEITSLNYLPDLRFETFIAISLAIFGFSLVMVLESLTHRKKNETRKI